MGLRGKLSGHDAERRRSRIQSKAFVRGAERVESAVQFMHFLKEAAQFVPAIRQFEKGEQISGNVLNATCPGSVNLLIEKGIIAGRGGLFFLSPAGKTVFDALKNNQWKP